MFGPIVNESRAHSTRTATPMITVAASCRSRGKRFQGWPETTPPASRPQIIGSRVMDAMPSGITAGPMAWATAEITTRRPIRIQRRRSSRVSFTVSRADWASRCPEGARSARAVMAVFLDRESSTAGGSGLERDLGGARGPLRGGRLEPGAKLGIEGGVDDIGHATVHSDDAARITLTTRGYTLTLHRTGPSLYRPDPRPTTTGKRQG